MQKINYSKDVDVLLIELSDIPIAYAEKEGDTILHYSEQGKLVVIEILDFRHSIPKKALQDLLVS